ncbi:MAG: SDR family oxidoreductase [Lachnospiraceae bacterium]|nr:SDR family oxidoreductase [Lachnospiraceae bacterium]
MKRVLVTGGAGFVGSHLCDRLIGEGYYVICLDNLFTGRLKNIAHLMKHPNFQFVEQDVTIPFKEKVDRIYNLACPASPPFYQADMVNTAKVCFLGTLNMLELAKECGARILQASTSEVYGDPHVHPQTESYRGNVNPVGIRSCYDEGKRISETLCFSYHLQHETDIRIIRIFNTYGPRMNPEDGRVVSNFIVQALKGEDITIYGDGSQTRSFCYVDDLVEGIYRMMENPDFTGPVNLGNPGEFDMIQLANLILEMTKSKSRLVYRPLPGDDPAKRRPDISLAKEKLNWEPSIPLKEGLERTIAYFKEEI